MSAGRRRPCPPPTARLSKGVPRGPTPPRVPTDLQLPGGHAEHQLRHAAHGQAGGPRRVHLVPYGVAVHLREHRPSEAPAPAPCAGGFPLATQRLALRHTLRTLNSDAAKATSLRFCPCRGVVSAGQQNRS